jgi:hypothetical protein
MSDEYFDRDAKQLLIDTYLADAPSAQKAFMKYLITSREKQMAKRRKLKPYQP